MSNIILIVIALAVIYICFTVKDIVNQMDSHYFWTDSRLRKIENAISEKERDKYDI